MSTHVGILGLGLTGLSLVRYYQSRGQQVSIFDERPQPPQLAALRAEFPELGYTRIADYTAISTPEYACDEFVVSPGIAPHRLPSAVPLRGELDVFAAEITASCTSLLVTVTGTNGKSTVCQLVANLLTASGRTAEAVGNIGVPLLDALARWQESGWPDFVVAELSSYQLASAQTSLRAEVAVLLNLSPDHLDWHGSFAEYTAAKAKIFANAQTCIYDVADENCAQLVTDDDNKLAFNSAGAVAAPGWGLVDGNLVCGDYVGPRQQELLANGIMPASAAAALTIVSTVLPDLANATLGEQLIKQAGLAHRFASVTTKNGVQFINDSKATNVAAAVTALQAVAGACIPIFGGDDKGQDFAKLASAVTACAIPAVVLLGDASINLYRALEHEEIAIERVVTMREAVRRAYELAEHHKLAHVLLSPACASHDSYPSFAARGEDYCAAVEALV